MYRCAGAVQYAATSGAAVRITHIPFNDPAGCFAFKSSSVVSVALVPSGGRPYFVAEAADGSRQRLDEAGLAAPLTAGDLSRIVAALSPGAGRTPPERMGEEDAYFFGHRHEPVRLPVLRVIADATVEVYRALMSLN